MRIAILTNEYPPHVYGGAGVHVEYLTRELARLDDGRHPVEVLCFGDQRESHGATLGVEGVQPPVELPVQEPRHAKLFATLLQDLVMTGRLGERRHRALPHLVHAPGRLPGQAPAPRAAGADDPFARAAPAVEGRAAGHRLRRVDLDRAHRLPERRRRDRRVRVDAARRPRALRRAARSGPGDSQRHRPGPVPADAAIRRCSTRHQIAATGRTCCSSAGSPGRRASSTWSTRSGTSSRACRWCCAPARRTRRRSCRR